MKTHEPITIGNVELDIERYKVGLKAELHAVSSGAADPESVLVTKHLSRGASS